jgi:hypothetical protein
LKMLKPGSRRHLSIGMRNTLAISKIIEKYAG